MFTKPPLWIHTLVQQAISDSSPHRLYQEIKEVNKQEHTGCTISLRALNELNNQSESVGISWGSFVALHVYFRSKGMSLQRLPILETRTVMDVFTSDPGG